MAEQARSDWRRQIGRHHRRRAHGDRIVSGRARRRSRAGARCARNRSCRRPQRNRRVRGRRSPHGLRAPGRGRTGAGAPGCVARRHPRRCPCEHGEQGLRIRHESGDARPRRDRVRQHRGGGGRRNGEHDQRTVSRRQGARRTATRSWKAHRPHVPRRSRGRVRRIDARAGDGNLRRRDRARSRLLACCSGRFRGVLARARPSSQRRRHVRRGDCRRS